MPSTELLITFFITASLFAYIPGPAMLYVTARTLALGRTAGLMAIVGIHVGCYVHVIAAAAGLSLIFHAVPVLYIVVKLAGASYVIWLGISLFRTKAEDRIVPGIAPKSGRRAFAESVLVEVLNPKTALFFLAFLPQFIDASASFPVWLQFVILGTIVNLLFSSADLVCVVLAGALSARLRRSSAAKRLVRRVGGTMLVGLGTHLALQKS